MNSYQKMYTRKNIIKKDVKYLNIYRDINDKYFNNVYYFYYMESTSSSSSSSSGSISLIPCQPVDLH
jgi:hypothetical protein